MRPCPLTTRLTTPTTLSPPLQALGERVEKVTVSNRLLDSPCALVTSKFGWSANMERIMRSQALGDARAMEYMKGRKIMEINPNHDIIAGIKTLLKVGRERTGCCGGFGCNVCFLPWEGDAARVGDSGRCAAPGSSKVHAH